MIGRLCGTLLEKNPPTLMIDVSGVGYEVEATMNCFYQLPGVGSNVTVHTHFVVREDAQLLYGFVSTRERDLFRTLIKVNGVGPKLGLTILSSIEADAFVRCVMTDDSSSLVRLPGVGKKTAQRLILDLRDRLSSWEINSLAQDASGARAGDARSDALSALIALGYKPQQASNALAQCEDEATTSEDLIRAALKEMV